MTITGTLITDGMGVGQLLIVEGFGVVGEPVIPEFINVFYDLSSIISAIPGPLIPNQTSAYVMTGTFTVEMMCYRPSGISIGSITSASISTVVSYDSSSIEAAFGIPLSELWGAIELGYPAILNIGALMNPISFDASVIDSPAVSIGNGLVPSIVGSEEIT